MKILIPTDFSEPSKLAISYAAKMAQKHHDELILLNAVFIDGPPKASVALKVNVIENAMADRAKQDSIQLIDEIRAANKGKLNISYRIIKGYPVEDVVENFATHHHIDLIIMGTKGASGLKKVLLGSNTTAAISKSSIPLIVIPGLARFTDLKHIVYATDMTNINAEMKRLVPFAKLFDATVHIIHIASSKADAKIDTKETIDKLVTDTEYLKIAFHVSENDDVLDGLDKYIAHVQADMLAMFTHDLGFFEKLFGRSVTRQMAFHNSIPMITLKK